MQKEKFEIWLNEKGLAEVTVNNYLRGIRYTEEKFAYLFGKESINIYQLSSSDIDLILGNEEFKAYDKKGNRMSSSGLKKYQEFLNRSLEVSGMQEELAEVKNGIFLDEHISYQDLLHHITQFITQKGFLYSQQNITNLYLSLRAKPFVILSGISGTGKTKIVQLFANAVGANYGNGRYRLISVRPDWSDSSDLLGYTNLQGGFVQGQLTEMVIRASDNPQEPHFVVLDEMNLARVEHYLSDFLSVIESRERVDGGVVTAPLVDVKGKAYGLPDNLYIIGTVNMDETTYPFSKKVLDRANSIEFNEIHLMNFAMLTELEELSPMAVHNSLFSADYLYLTELYSQHEALVRDVSEILEGFNKQLQTIYAQVGYRVRDEICFYMAYATETELSEDEAMDFCIMQKILPRISGAGEELELLLEAFFKDFAGISYAKEAVIPEDAKYARSAKKVQEMRKRLATQGFTSFWIA